MDTCVFLLRLCGPLQTEQLRQSIMDMYLYPQGQDLSSSNNSLCCWPLGSSLSRAFSSSADLIFKSISHLAICQVLCWFEDGDKYPQLFFIQTYWHICKQVINQYKKNNDSNQIVAPGRLAFQYSRFCFIFLFFFGCCYLCELDKLIYFMSFGFFVLNMLIKLLR